MKRLVQLLLAVVAAATLTAAPAGAAPASPAAASVAASVVGEPGTATPFTLAGRVVALTDTALVVAVPQSCPDGRGCTGPTWAVRQLTVTTSTQFTVDGAATEAGEFKPGRWVTVSGVAVRLPCDRSVCSRWSADVAVSVTARAVPNPR